MVQCAGGTRFRDELAGAIRMATWSLVQDLEGHFAREPGIPRTVHRAPAALTQARKDLVRSDNGFVSRCSVHTEGFVFEMLTQAARERGRRDCAILLDPMKRFRPIGTTQ